MTTDEFRRRVLGQGTDLSKESLETAIEQCVKERHADEGHIDSCLQLARLLETFRLRLQSAAESSSSTQLITTPEAFISSDRRAEAIRPWVEQVRLELFGSTNPPFRTYEGALKWLETTGRETSLESTSQAMAAATGFAQSAIVAYVLTGTTPFLSAAEIRVQTIMQALPTGGTVKRTEATIMINWGDLSFNQLRAAHREIRKAFRTRKIKRLTERDQQLIEMVRRFGGEPPKGKQKVFWQQRQQEWNAEVQDRQYKTWRGMQKRYQGLMKKLEIYLQ